ncbi:MAG: hypothetical protein WCV69_02470 [Patescibacteria group bacterium]|jgi:hypothetical protein
MNKDLRGKKVLILQQRGWAITIGHNLAKKLKQEGCELIAVTLKRDTYDFIVNQKDVNYEAIVSIDDIMEDPEKVLAGEDISLEKICSDLGIDTIWPFIYSNRLLVYSYREKYYYSYRQNVSDEFMVNYVKAYYKSLRDLFEKFKPDVVFLAAFISDIHAILNLLAKKYGIPTVSIINTRIDDFHVFTGSCYNESGEFFDYLKSLNNSKIEGKNKDRARKYIDEFRANFKKPWDLVDHLKQVNTKKSWKKIIRHELSPYYHSLMWYFQDSSKNYIKSIGSTLDYRTPRVILRDFYGYKRYRKAMENFKYYPLEKIGKCVYFPLQFQPEGAIDYMATFFSNQIEVARLIAMSLPGDYTLMVKDHPGMLGYRSPSYLEKIFRTPNIKLIDYRIPTELILKKADLVLSPNSTTLLEAAFLNKPAIQFGNMGTTLELPNVIKHTDFTTLSSKIKERLSLNLISDDYERKLENYVTAIFDTGFDINYSRIWEKGKKMSDDFLIDKLIGKIAEVINKSKNA